MPELIISTRRIPPKAGLLTDFRQHTVALLKSQLSSQNRATAEALLLFASRAGKHITGQILAVDGGVSAVHGGG